MHVDASPTPVCEVCGAAMSTLWLPCARDYVTGEQFSVRRCVQCDLAVTCPQPSSMDWYYEQQYRRYNAPTAGILRLLYRWRVWVWVRKLGRPGLALEIGCGEGWMLAALRAHGWRVVGSERTVDGARFAVRTHGLPVFVGSLEAVRPARIFDVIVLFHVLEHLKTPMEILSRCEQALKPGGTLIVAVPNARSWQARLFGATWFHLDVPRHLYHFSAASLSRALETVGLFPQRPTFVSLEHDPFGWVQSVLNRLGFGQNLLTSTLMGTASTRRSRVHPVIMTVVALALIIPSLVASTCSWIASAGAVMEVRARKPA